MNEKFLIQSSINQRFYELIQDIELNTQINGEVDPRGLKVKESLLTIFSIDPQYPCIDFENRKFNYKYFAAEVVWYLLKSDNISFISKFSNFWNNIATQEGKINSNYGKLLFTNNPETQTTQMAWVVNSLRKDKNTRQAIAYIGGPNFQYSQNKDFVCTQYLNFFIRNDELHMKVQMRSNDIFYGLMFDAPWFSLVHQNTYLELKETYPELKLGKYFHSSDNSHYYQRHFEIAKDILLEDVKLGPKIELQKPLWHTYEDGKCVISAKGIDFLDYFHQNINELAQQKNDYFKNVIKKIVDLN